MISRHHHLTQLLKTTHWKFYLVIFITIELLIFFGLRYRYHEQHINIIDEYTNNLQATHQIVMDTLEIVSQTIFNEIASQPELVEILKQANQQPPKQRQNLQQRLLQKLLPSHERLKKQNLKLINFYLDDNSHFFNFDLYTDAQLFAVTPQQLSAPLNLAQELARGFKEDFQGYYFRYIYPLTEQQNHIADIEIGFSFDAITVEMLRVRREHYDFIVNKTSIPITFLEKESVQFQASQLSDHFLQNISDLSHGQKKYSPPALRLLSTINQALRHRVAQKLLLNAPFVEFATLDTQNFSATFSPVKNIHDKVIGYLVAYSKDTKLTALDQDFLFHTFILTLMNGAFMFFLFQANHNRYLVEYQKENLVTSNAILERWVDERVSELIETNISLHQEILDRKKIEEQLKLYQDHLEELVEERTQQLSTVNNELIQFNRERVKDIIKLRQTETALRESEEMFRRVSQSLVDALIVINSLGNIIFWSSSAERIFGYTEAEVLGNNLHNLILSQGTTPTIAQALQRFSESGEGAVFNKLLEFHATRKNGELFPIEVSIVALKLKEEWTAVSTVRDITERRQKEQELQAALEAMEQANRIIAEKNREISDNYTQLQQTLQHLQTAQRELIQSEKMAALGQLIAGVAHEINTPLGAIRSSVANIEEFVQRDLLAIPHFFQTLSAERQADFFALLNFAIAQHEILTSKEKRQLRKKMTLLLTEAQLAEPELLADRLIDIGIYDDITPWLPLLQSVDYQRVLEMLYQIVSLQKSTATIATASDRAAKVVFALKSFSRFDHSGKKVLTQISEGIETVLTLYHNKLKFGVELNRDYETVPKIYCFPDELNQVWTNLIHNALQAMNNQGILTIQIKTQDSYIVISISDTGDGIPEEIKQRIFEPFFTTKPVGEGSGLGLDIVKKIIEKHGGRIELHSQLGQGTTFSVFLPIILEPEPIPLN